MADALKPTGMFVIYIDESYDSTAYAYSALMIPIIRWNSSFERVIKWRKWIQENAGIPIRHELHATDFIAGRSQPNQNRNKSFRGFIFQGAFSLIENMPDVRVVNALASNKHDYLRLFERMMNRINRTLEHLDSYGILVCDEGNENKLISMIRKMKKFNIIPGTTSIYGPGGSQKCSN